jgi:hypothetical protein
VAGANTGIQDATDQLAARLPRPLSDADVDHLFSVCEPVVRRILDARAIPFPHPIGLPHRA